MNNPRPNFPALAWKGMGGDRRAVNTAEAIRHGSCMIAQFTTGVRTHPAVRPLWLFVETTEAQEVIGMSSRPARQQYAAVRGVQRDRIGGTG